MDNKESARAHGQTDPNRTGPRPKELVEATFMGKPVGRDGIVVDPDEVFKLAQIGCKNHEIANWFGIKEQTLRYNFREELVKGREHLKITLRRAMLNNAIQNNSPAVQIFLSKNILGMADSPTTTDDAKILPWTDDDMELEEEHFDAIEHTTTEDS